RVRLLRRGPQEHWLTFTAHHIVCDGWSLAVVLRDLGALYSAARTGQPAALPPAPRFSDHAAGHHAQHGQDSAALRHWLDLFTDAPPLLDLPLDRPRPALKTYAADRLDYPLDPSLVAGLKKLGPKFGCSFFVTLLAGYATFLARLTGQTDLVIGVPAAG